VCGPLDRVTNLNGGSVAPWSGLSLYRESRGLQIHTHICIYIYRPGLSITIESPANVVFVSAAQFSDVYKRSPKSVGFTFDASL
jgi:hypothetical protein